MSATASFPVAGSGPPGSIALTAAARLWFLVNVIGQMLFATSVAAFYGRAAGRGDFDAWNKTMTHGHVADEPIGNVVVGVHLVSAVIIILGGALQLLPQLRGRAPAFHRWNGRLYVAAAFTVSLAGLYMLWFRGTIGDLSQHLGQSLDGILIMLFAVLALRAARAREFRAHGRWAMRLYLVVSASLFIRAGNVLSIPLGIDASATTGPFFTIMTYAQYLLPLGVLELYWRARDGRAPEGRAPEGHATGRIAMAAGLSVLSLVLGAGIAGATTAMFLPNLELGFSNRILIAEPLAATLAASGVEAAVDQYHRIRAEDPGDYDLAEDELNQLGYKLLFARKYVDAVRILQLNVEAYPRSGNAYDSLGEAYMDAGDKPHAIASYSRSLQLTPSNANAVRMLGKLRAGGAT